jgi:hypothetical protein
MTFPRLRRRVVFAPLPGRERVGLSERAVAAAQRPRTGLVLIAGALGFSPDFQTKGALESSPPGHRTHSGKKVHRGQ